MTNMYCKHIVDQLLRDLTSLTRTNIIICKRICEKFPHQKPIYAYEDKVEVHNIDDDDEKSPL